MENKILPDTALAWLCDEHGWTDHGPRDGEWRIAEMSPPKGERVDVLFIGRDENSSSNWTYGIPVGNLKSVDFVVLFSLSEDLDLLGFDANELLALQAKSAIQNDDDDGRWRVAVDYFCKAMNERPALHPVGSPELRIDVCHALIAGPDSGISLAEWHATRSQAEPVPVTEDTAEKLLESNSEEK